MERAVQSKLNKIRRLYTVPLCSIEVAKLCNTILFHREARDRIDFTALFAVKLLTQMKFSEIYSYTCAKSLFVKRRFY